MQHTDEETIAEEKKVVRKLVGLDERVEIAFSDSGWTSRVYIVNAGEIVVKFPREERVKEEYAREVSAYKIARDVGGVLVPVIRWEHPNKDYLGYNGVVGETADKVISSLTSAEKRSVGGQLGTFLRDFHQRDISYAPLISQEYEFADYSHKLALGLPVLANYFSEPEVSTLKGLVLEEYPQRATQLGFHRGLCHGDLGYWNLIYGRDGRIGIIDFGDVGYYDTSIDFAGMNDSAILDAALEAYGADVSREKIALRQRIIPIFDLPFFVRKNDKAGIDRTVEQIRTLALQTG